MRPSHIVAVAATLSCAFSLSAQPWCASQPAVPLAELATRLPMLDTPALLYDRSPSIWPAEVRKRCVDTLAEVCDAPRGAEELEQALHSDNPRVRTLALVGLFYREDPRYLPAIIDMIADTAETFPRPRLAHLRFGESTPTEPQTVGQVALAMLRFYQNGDTGQFSSPPSDGDIPTLRDEFRAWWMARCARPYSLSVLRVQRDRATSRGRGALSALVQRIRQLPPVDEEVVLLGLLTEPQALRQIDSQVLIYAGRRLGPERLMQLLEGRPLIDDPDYAASACDPSAFILTHATELLRVDDVPRLHALAEQHGNYRYIIAAAQLAPQAGVSWLRDALTTPSSWWHADEIAWALWNLGGAEAAGALVAWFYGPRSAHDVCPPYTAQFAQRLLVRFDRRDRWLLGRLVDDPRFADAEWSLLKTVAAGLNENLLQAVVTPERLANVRHPVGEGRFHRWLAEHPQEYAEETATVQVALAEWVAAIRGSRPQWAVAADDVAADVAK